MFDTPSIWLDNATTCRRCPFPRRDDVPQYTRYSELSKLLIEPVSGAPLTMSGCHYREHCTNESCTRFHTLDAMLAFFSRDEIVAFYRAATLKCSTSVSSSSGDRIVLSYPTPRHFVVRDREQFLLHRTPESAALCRQHCVVPQNNMLLMEKFTVNFTIRLCDHESRLIHPECLLTCFHCGRHLVLYIYV